jgi:hypothetical protein
MSRSSDHSPKALVVIVGALVVGTVIARRLGYKVGGKVMVRCRAGHLFETLWIPGVKLTAIDLGIARLQRCPVGHHWSLVTPVRVSGRRLLPGRRSGWSSAP